MVCLLYPVDIDFVGVSFDLLGRSAEGRRELKALLDSMACTSLSLSGNLTAFEDLGGELVKLSFKTPGGNDATSSLMVDFSTGNQERVLQIRAKADAFQAKSESPECLLFRDDINFVGMPLFVSATSAHGRKALKALLDCTSCTQLNLKSHLMSFTDLGSGRVKFFLKNRDGDQNEGGLRWISQKIRSKLLGSWRKRNSFS
jgi:hypothetical protein